jgi:hypothetical protein
MVDIQSRPQDDRYRSNHITDREEITTDDNESDNGDDTKQETRMIKKQQMIEKRLIPRADNNR